MQRFAFCTRIWQDFVRIYTPQNSVLLQKWCVNLLHIRLFLCWLLWFLFSDRLRYWCWPANDRDPFPVWLANACDRCSSNQHTHWLTVVPTVSVFARNRTLRNLRLWKTAPHLAGNRSLAFLIRAPICINYSPAIICIERYLNLCEKNSSYTFARKANSFVSDGDVCLITHVNALLMIAEQMKSRDVMIFLLSFYQYLVMI